jgi:hypothetical protein
MVISSISVALGSEIPGVMSTEAMTPSIVAAWATEMAAAVHRSKRSAAVRFTVADAM